MKMKWLVLALVLLTPNIFSDTRTENLDVVLVLDKSLSMEDHVEKTRRYIAESVFSYLEPGDTITPILFFGQTQVLDTVEIKSEADKTRLLRRLQSEKANGRYTDIGNALDTLEKVLARLSNTERRKYLVLVTDEKQEAPPESKYFSKDGVFTHPYLTWTAKKQMDGFSVIILGVGIESKINEKSKFLIETISDPSARNGNEGGTPKTDKTQVNSGNQDSTRTVQPSPGIPILYIARPVILILLVLLAIYLRKLLQSKQSKKAEKPNDV